MTQRDEGPGFQAFAEARSRGRAQIVWRRLIADTLTPVAAMLRLGSDGGQRFILESVEGGAHRGRYSVIGLEPDLVWRCRHGRAEISRRAGEGGSFVADGEALRSLRSLLRASRIEAAAHPPPMAAGLFGYLGYDAVRMMETLPGGGRDALKVWDGLYMRPTVTIVFDAVEGAMYLASPVWPDDQRGASQAFQSAERRLDDIAARLQKPCSAEILPSSGRRSPTGQPEGQPAELPSPQSNLSAEAFSAMVEKARAYIHAGDVFQVVLSQRFFMPFKAAPFTLYRALRRLNPSPFLFYFHFHRGFALVGSSPEILVRSRGASVTIRPLAGTRPRGASAEEDRRLARELLADPKEKAEHLMLLDLGRNDVGRVASIGSVKVTERMKIEYYSHVMHLVSNVHGRRRDDCDGLDALIAGFPAGTVSGAPKIRAMEIIDELEPERRGVYAGAVGYFSASGDLDSCIALRTAVIQDGVLHVQAGGGIVADSTPMGEYQESCNKAKAVLRAASDALRLQAQAANR